MKNTQWVVYHNKRWIVKTEGSKQITADFKNKVEAENFAKNIAKNLKTEMIVKKRNGEIQYRNSYGNDPYPPRG